MKQLSANEQKVLLAIQRARGGSPRKRKRPIAKRAKGCLLAVVCASGLLTADVLRAADAPSVVSIPALFKDGDAAPRAARRGPAILDGERACLPAPRGAGVAAPVIPRKRPPAYWLSFNSLAGLAGISLLLFNLLFFGTRLIPLTLRQLARGVASSLPSRTRLSP